MAYAGGVSPICIKLRDAGRVSAATAQPTVPGWAGYGAKERASPTLQNRDMVAIWRQQGIPLADVLA
jgi:hypothetical protein